MDHPVCNLIIDILLIMWNNLDIYITIKSFYSQKGFCNVRAVVCTVVTLRGIFMYAHVSNINSDISNTLALTLLSMPNADHLDRPILFLYLDLSL